MSKPATGPSMDDETRRKFREALEKKQAKHKPTAEGDSHHGPSDHHTEAGGQKMFRRKSGG